MVQFIKDHYDYFSREGILSKNLPQAFVGLRYAIEKMPKELQTTLLNWKKGGETKPATKTPTATKRKALSPSSKKEPKNKRPRT